MGDINRLLLSTLGGCGDVVRRVLPALARRWRVFALVRQREPALRDCGVVQLRGDLDHPASLARLAGISDDTPFQILCDGADYRKLESQLCYPGDREQFVRFETVD